MRRLELLAPARNADIGIAAIDCGADAVYIAGPMFGARQAAGNEIADIKRLCDYAHRYGAKIFVTLNTILFDSELEEAGLMMNRIADAGADAVIVQDMAIPMIAAGHSGNEKDIPLHASTQCAIRTPEQARFLESLGFSRLILERELSLEQVKAIREAVECELEFFVHGALCVCYSGQCYLSEHITGRSANRGTCIQACRSRYDLSDANGKILARNRALLSLKDYNLKDRIEELAEAGIVSFKIEGRLKNESYVRNVVREYSIALDNLVQKFPDRYARASYGKVDDDFTPDPSKTFNRGYTELFIDGRRAGWLSGDSAKHLGEETGTVVRLNKDKTVIEILPAKGKEAIRLNNGDGFSFVSRNGEIIGFRGDICDGYKIKCKATPELSIGTRLFRNVDMAFEKAVGKAGGSRRIKARVFLEFSGNDCGTYSLDATATTEDGRKVQISFPAGNSPADNQERMLSILENNISKSSGIYDFSLEDSKSSGKIPFMPASSVNAVRRALAERLDTIQCISHPLYKSSVNGIREETKKEFRKLFTDGHVGYKANVSNSLARELYKEAGATSIDDAYELSHVRDAELMRTKYCVRYETGMCPKHHGSKSGEDLFLTNNGRRLTLHFDCRNCEMTVSESNA